MRLPLQGEGSSFTVEVETFNELDQPVTMNSVEYRIDCKTNKRTVRDWTAITPDTAMDINVAPADNVIINDTNRRELRQMTIRVNDDLATQLVDPDPVEWYVANVMPGRNIVT